jgi:hypothetical protein
VQDKVARTDRRAEVEIAHLDFLIEVRISSVEPLISAKNAVTVLRSPSGGSPAGCSSVTRPLAAAVAAWSERAADDVGVPARAAPQSSKNADEGAFSATHFGQRLDSGLPHKAQNFRPVVLSFPALSAAHRLTPPERATEYLLYHPTSPADIVRTSIPSEAKPAQFSPAEIL